MTSSISKDVSFRSEELTMAGTFVDVRNARAVALILTGSGPLDRDSNAPKLRIGVSPAIADALELRGVSSLRYDKRGAGQSGGNYFAAGMTENYSDARAALGWLATSYPSLPAYVIGQSEGALHAAHLAADGEVSGAVLLACPARTGEEILTWQAAKIIPTLPASTKAILRLIHLDPLKSQRKQFARIRATSANSIRVQGRKLNARWLRQFVDYDPMPIFEQISVPILAIIGEHDMQVPPEEVETIKRLVKGPCEAHVVDGMSHLLRSDPDSKGPRDYRRAVHQPVSPEVLRMITDWIDQHLSD